MDEKENILALLPARLKAARAQRGLSLDAVAKLSGVSRSMVSQIERGESSPTIATLWNLTTALQVDFAGLLDEQDRAVITVQRASDAPLIEKRGSGCKIKILSQPEDAGQQELYDLTFQSGGVLDSQPHGTGAQEHLTVLDGRIVVTSGEATEMLEPGDTAHYPADVPHAIRAEGTARAFLVVRGG
ncbi:HTH-type transcriptional regulator SutR [Pontivivens insulae]|uniref:HTH-type transcriptional regulator SutR n=2 Tax=Pontivivens insulae TaxID=1639689 RepID=A0A2R8AD01_9RHOB|nr:XRE family transcriptional regulator [Pontivivens insulae]SPF30123.1 HTH-type transcriptional regulator SutR [Pontivivens insulae]